MNIMGYNLFKDEFNQIRNAYSEEIDDNTYNPKESRSEIGDVRSVVIERQGGLANRFVLLLLILWYLFSALTLFTNKYIVTTRKADPTVIGKLLFSKLSLSSRLVFKCLFFE